MTVADEPSDGPWQFSTLQLLGVLSCSSMTLACVHALRTVENASFGANCFLSGTVVVTSAATIGVIIRHARQQLLLFSLPFLTVSLVSALGLRPIEFIGGVMLLLISVVFSALRVVSAG